jgi:hypothetical protein
VTKPDQLITWDGSFLRCTKAAKTQAANSAPLRAARVSASCLQRASEGRSEAGRQIGSPRSRASAQSYSVGALSPRSRPPCARCLADDHHHTLRLPSGLEQFGRLTRCLFHIYVLSATPMATIHYCQSLLSISLFVGLRFVSMILRPPLCTGLRGYSRGPRCEDLAEADRGQQESLPSLVRVLLRCSHRRDGQPILSNCVLSIMIIKAGHFIVR